MGRAFDTANDAWLIQANIARIELILQGKLTAPQRDAMERLVAEQRLKLENLAHARKSE